MTTALAVIVARYLGPSDYGVFAGFLGLSQVVTLVFLGVPVWLLRELSAAIADEDGHDAQLASQRVSTGLAIVAAATIGLTIATLAFAYALGSDVRLTLTVAALMAYVGLLGCSNVIEVVFRAHRRLSLVFRATMLEKAGLLAMIAAATVLGLGLIAIAAAYVIAAVSRIALDLYCVRAGNMTQLGPASRAHAMDVIRSSIPFSLGTTIPSGIVRLDVFLMGLFSSTLAGFYAVADRFLSVLYIVPVAASNTLYPHLAHDDDRVRATRQIALLVAAMGGVLGGIGFLLADDLVTLLFGPRFADASSALRIMLVGAPVMFAVTVLTVGLFAGGHERGVSVVMVIGALLGSVLVVIGQALEGLEGAAAGYVCRYILMLLGLVGFSIVVERRARGGRTVAASAAHERAAPAVDADQRVPVPKEPA